MAVDEKDEQSGGNELARLERSIKTNRIFLVTLLVVSVISLSILGTSMLVINMQMSDRREVASEEFAKDLNLLAEQLEHISTLHNSEAKVYFDFQDSLEEIATLYTSEEINSYKKLLIEREKDQRNLLKIMAAGADNLAQMLPGNRSWVTGYKKAISAAEAESKQREQTIQRSMQAKPLPAPVKKSDKSQEKPAVKE